MVRRRLLVARPDISSGERKIHSPLRRSLEGKRIEYSHCQTQFSERRLEPCLGESTFPRT
jgi:hypothetical protein